MQPQWSTDDGPDGVGGHDALWQPDERLPTPETCDGDSDRTCSSYWHWCRFLYLCGVLTLNVYCSVILL